MKKKYFQNLDGLRFFAFLAVFFAHSFWSDLDHINNNVFFYALKKIVYNGVLGVNFFFVLSGFLITYLLLEEKSFSGKINIPAFYMRRVLRIWPLYYFVVFIGFVVVPFAQNALGQPTAEVGNIWYYVFFVGNFDVKPTSAVLGILWSIAVEEQFYLVWPVLFSLVPARFYSWLFPIIIAIAIPAQFIAYPKEGSLLYSNPIVCMSDLAMGGWFAYGVFHSERFRQLLKGMSRNFIVFVYIVGTAFLFSMYKLNDMYFLFSIFSRVVLSVYFAFIILEQNYADNSFYKVSRFKNISKLGLYTYSLYMLHFMCIYVINKLLSIVGWDTKMYQVIILQTLFNFVASVVVAWLSYNYLEKFFLSLKHRFSVLK